MSDVKLQDALNHINALLGCSCDDDMTASGHSPACKWHEPMEVLEATVAALDEARARVAELEKREHEVREAAGMVDDFLVRAEKAEAEVKRQKAIVLSQTRLNTEAIKAAEKAEARLAALEQALREWLETHDHHSRPPPVCCGLVGEPESPEAFSARMKRTRAALSGAEQRPGLYLSPEDVKRVRAAIGSAQLDAHHQGRHRAWTSLQEALALLESKK